MYLPGSKDYVVLQRSSRSMADPCNGPSKSGWVSCVPDILGTGGPGIVQMVS